MAYEEDELTAREEEELLEELRTVADIDETSDAITIFAPAVEVHQLGVKTIMLIGGWLLQRKRERQARDTEQSHGQSNNPATESNLRFS